LRRLLPASPGIFTAFGILFSSRSGEVIVLFGEALR
jgi:hypothetical protein